MRLDRSEGGVISEDGGITGIWTNSHPTHHTDIASTRDTPQTMGCALANLVVCPTWHSVLALGSEREFDATRCGVRELMRATVGSDGLYWVWKQIGGRLTERQVKG